MSAPDAETIVYVVPYYPPFGAGGAEFTASLHAGLLVQRGQPVLVVTPNYGAADREIVDGVEVVRHPFMTLKLGQQVPPHRFSFASYQRRLAGEIVRAAAGRRIRCIHVQHQYMLRGGAQAARSLGVPLVGHLRDTSQICSLGALCLLEKGTDTPPMDGCGALQHAVCHQTRFAPTYLAGKSLVARAARLAPATLGWSDWRARGRAFDSAARVAFASDGLRHLYENLPPFRRRERNRTVYSPLLLFTGKADETRLPAAVRALKAEGKPIVLSVGKVSRGKGSDVMFAAWRQVAAAVPDARLVVAGNVDENAWDIDRNTTVLTGFVDRATVDALYAAADIVVMSSSWPEPLSRSILDAARHGKPIVATRVGGTAEAVTDGATGVLVERLDAGALAQATIGLLQDSGRRVAMGVQAQQKVAERFGPEAVSRQLEALYAGL